ncbi:MAG: peptide ABC transporter substrate-binding protein [Candidatus Tectomicrobia bacterium]|uniref:Peptide ABC transporter substrate-binding protein n=1 Tax=Tectimicrobiota bacterium TaxID=2528274 RepID=A0A933GMG9_UNCTE|nr:peptide ABC transporter substrate-binding protein [Candidatus Tectomicrobia bacterium]
MKLPVFNRRSFLRLCLGAPLFALTSCLNFNSKSKNSLRMPIGSEPPTLDWNLATDSVSFRVITNIMEGLAQFDENLKPVPAVAKSWDTSNYGQTYTFQLRKDVFWSDGKGVTAKDFEYSWKRLLAPQTAAEYAYFLYDIENAQAYNAGEIADHSRLGIRSVDDFTLEVKLRRPLAYFPSLVTFMVTFPMRQDIVEKFGDTWTDPTHIVTNGPFLLRDWRHEYKVTLEPNPHYFEGKPLLKKVEMFVVEQPFTSLTLYEMNEVDMTSLPPMDIMRYTKDPEYINYPLLSSFYFGFNVKKEPFTDVRIRKAFSMAMDRKEFPKILKGGEIPSSSWIPKGMFGYDPGLGLNYDPQGAKDLLSETGYPEGKGFPEVTLVFNSSPTNQLIAEKAQEQWKRNLGISAKLENMEWKVFLEKLNQDPPALYRLGWNADFPDPDNFMNLFLAQSGNNHTNWENPKYDELVVKAAEEIDHKIRLQMYQEAQRILCREDVPIMPLYTSAQNLLVKRRVKGFRPNAMDILYLKRLKLE